MPFRFRRGSVAIFCLIFLAAIPTLLYFGSKRSRADDESAENADAFDRAPKPAGKLLVDAATGLPAVTPLTVNFIRSPDKTGPDGKGGYLIAVNSGYGLEFSSKSKAQQTLSVIDLNLLPEPKVIQNIYVRQE